MDKSFIYYHNPRCSKSREGLKILEKNTENVKVKLYLSDAISFSELEQIIKKLRIKPIDLVRKKEPLIKEKNLPIKDMTDKEIIETLLNYPILIERPILVSNNDAAIGRPPEHIKSIL